MMRVNQVMEINQLNQDETNRGNNNQTLMHAKGRRKPKRQTTTKYITYQTLCQH